MVSEKDLKNNFKRSCFRIKRSYLCIPLENKKTEINKSVTRKVDLKLKKEDGLLEMISEPTILKKAKADLEKVL